MTSYYVYILTNQSGTLYIGMTNELLRRMYEHRNKLVPGFTVKYNISRLVYYEQFPSAIQTIEAEKKFKGWRRAKKIALIKSMNPNFKDLYEEICDETEKATQPAKNVPQQRSL